MKFGNIQAAYLLWLVFFTGLFYFWSLRKQKRLMQGFAETALLKEIASSVDYKKKKMKAILIVAVVTLSVFALMRPKWGFQMEEVKRQGLDILVAIDTSKSMLAQDVKPNRLERSKLAVRDLVKKLKGDRIGLIAFSGDAFLQCPLTVDYNGFILSLDSLTSDIIPKGGTAITSAIKEAVNVFSDEPRKYRILIIITDGEDHEGNVARASEAAKKEEIKVFTIGIGTPEGDLIQFTDKNGRENFLKDREGNVVKTKIDEEILQKIARVTGGSYIHAVGAEFGLDLLYKEKLSKMEKRALESKMVKQYEERFQIPLFFAILFLVAEALANERKRA